MNKQVCKILIIDDDADVLHSARMFLRQYFEQVDTEQNPAQINALVSRTQPDVVLLDMNFKRGEHDGREGLYWLERIRTMAASTAVILITAYGDIELAVEAMRMGAANFVLKPWKNSKLLETIEAALARREKPIRQTKKGAAPQLEEEVAILGTAPAMRRMYQLMDKVADTEANILILGENGTGKELVAHTLHQKSSRRQGAFIRVDLGALTPTLFESEMFGHVKGAFTDAFQDKPGKFELAQGGTLFLDEIGNLSLPQQAKLLTVLQSRSISRVGANQQIPLDIRLICATNMPLYDMVNDTAGLQEDGFRQDLLYRINTVELFVPPLRERVEDIPLLAAHFLEKFGKRYGKTHLQLSPQALDKLQNNAWPGNVRELEHAIERAVILCEGDTLSPGLFNTNLVTLLSASDTPAALTLDENEKIFIKKALARNQGNITKTAKELGVTRTALYRRLDKYGL